MPDSGTLPSFLTVTWIVTGLPLVTEVGETLTEVTETSWTTTGSKVNVAIEAWTIEPLVPVMFTEKDPGVAEEHERLAVPELVTLDGVIPQVSPEGMVSVSLTLPVKPFRPVTVIIEVADWPTLAGDGEVAEMEKLKGCTAVMFSVPSVRELSGGVGSLSPVGKPTIPFIV